MTDTPVIEVATFNWLTLCGGFRNQPFVKCSPGVFVVALDTALDTALGTALETAQQVLFLREPRVYDDVRVLGLPAGAIDAGEDIALSANRELREETGFAARRIHHLHTFHPLSRHAEWTIDAFLARDLYESPLQGDEGYAIEVVRHPLASFETLIASGELRDSTVIAALYMTRAFLERENNHAE